MALFDTTWYVNFGNGTSTGYYAVPLRPQNTAVAAGQLCRQFTAPSVGNERVFVCIVAGTTANVTDATWVLTRGAKTVDGTVTWMECSGQAGLNGDLVDTATWTQVKAVTPAVLGQVIKRSNNVSYQICTTAGAMSASEPAFSDTAGVTTTDTTAVWTSLGPVSNFTGGQAPHARLANVFGSNWFTSGNTVYVGDNHAETQGSAMTIGGNSALLAKILCHNHSGSYPPAASDITTGATISTTTLSTLNFTGQGSFYFYGITFAASLANSNVSMQLSASGVGQTQNWYYFDNCSLQVGAGGSSVYLGGTSTAWGIVVLNNTTIRLGATAGFILPAFVQLLWQNTGSILAAGSSIPTTLFQQTNSSQRFNTIALRNLDLSQLTGSLFSNAANSSIGSLIVQDCKLNAAMTVTPSINSGMPVQLIRSDSGATAYKSTRYAYEGTETTETSIVRTGGAVDPNSQAQSRKIVTSANPQWLRPFKAEPYAIWNSTVGSPVTVTVCGTVNAGALPNNDDIWMETEYLGDAGVAAILATWNTADIFGVALSGGNLIATQTGGPNAFVRATNSHLPGSGKFYWEVTATLFVNGNTIHGFCPSTLSIPNGSSPTGIFGVETTGAIYYNGSYTGTSLGTGTSGTVFGFALDLNANLAWVRIPPSGNWNNSGTANPATGVGGISVSAITGTDAIPVFAPGGSGDKVTANFGASAFVGSVPSGFTAGWATTATTISPKGTIVTTTKSNVLASPAAVASDSSVWGTPHTTLDGAKSASVTMSNGNLTATCGGGILGTVISSAFLGGGKYYFEYVIQSHTTNQNGLGVILSTGALTDPGNPNTTTSTCMVVLGGSSTIFTNGASTGKNLGTAAVGSNFSCAIDFTNRLAWFRKDGGNWNADGTANPATGVGGVALIAGLFAPFVYFPTVATTTDAMTVNFGQSAYTYTAPSGFLSWDTGWTSFKLAATITPQLPGYIHARVRAAKASTTYYVDPKITVTIPLLGPPLDAVASVTGAWSFGRNMLTSFGAGTRYTKTGTAITALNDQSGNSRNFTMPTSASQPVEATAFPANVLCADFDGVDDYLGVGSALSTFITASSGAVVVSVIVDAVTLNSGLNYGNHGIIADASGYIGIYAKNLSGVTVYSYNYDGNEDVATATGSVGIAYVLMLRHHGGNLYFSINGGVEASAASGNTQVLSAGVYLGGGYSNVCNCKIAEAFFTSDGSQTAALAAAIANMKTYIGA